MTPQEAQAKIAENLKAVEALVNECTALADEHKLIFSFDVAGYGMGGYYDGAWEESDYTDNGWNASSQSC